MSAPTTTAEHMLLFKGTLWDRDLSAEELQQVMTRWMDWFDRLTREGKVKAQLVVLLHGERIVARGGAGRS